MAGAQVAAAAGLSLAVVQAAILARITRSAVLEVLREDFVRTARAKGLSRRAGAVAPRAAQRDDPGADDHGPAVRRPARRHHRRRERVLAAGPRPADLPVDLQPRPDRRAQLRDVARRDGRRRQLRRRPALCGDRPAAAGAPAMVCRSVRAGLRPPQLRARRAADRRCCCSRPPLSLVWTPWPPAEIDIPNKLQSPSAAHWLGTDSLGRDIASLLLVGARNSILVGVIAVGIGLALGMALGLLAAARRGWVEEADHARCPTSPSPSRRCCRRSC